MKDRYVVIGANPFTAYTGTETFTGLRIVDTFDELKDFTSEMRRRYFDECGGLYLVLDTKTNKEVII